MDKITELIPMLAEYTAVISAKNGLIRFTERGIKPLYDLVMQKTDIAGAVAVDRVVGKAAALLYVGLKISALYAGVISKPALSALEKSGIATSYGEVVPYIINRKGDGRCPMEEAVTDIEDFTGAVTAIGNKLAAFNGGKMKNLGFGLMRLPLINPDDRTSVDLEQVCKMTDAFIERGYTYFDTAYMYHDFKSELFIKEALVKRYPRDKFLLADKLPSMFLKAEGDQERIFAEQLDKCGVDYFDYYLIHCLDKDNYAKAQKFDSFGFAMKMKAEGKIKKLGFSFHDTAEMLEKIITEHPETEFVQLQINYLDWEDGAVQSRACYEVARKYGKEIIVMEPIKGGTLANIPQKAKDILYAENAELTPAEWALNFAAELDGVIMVLSGMSDFYQLDCNTKLFDKMKPLSSEQFTLLTETVSAIIREPQPISCTACSYCTEGCPKKIAIPSLFAAYNTFITDGEKGKEELEKASESGGKPTDCIACRKCEKICPQHLPIVKNLKKIGEMLEK